MGDLKTFEQTVLLASNIKLIQNVNVSVFETNIRLIGGLLSSHIIATTHMDSYDGSSLLNQAGEL
jgi:ER degradation enhancer, mannosidase alpha-like 2